MQKALASAELLLFVGAGVSYRYAPHELRWYYVATCILATALCFILGLAARGKQIAYTKRETYSKEFQMKLAYNPDLMREFMDALEAKDVKTLKRLVKEVES